MKNDLSSIADYYMLPDSSYCFTVNSGYEMQFKTMWVPMSSERGNGTVCEKLKIENWKVVNFLGFSLSLHALTKEKNIDNFYY